MKEIAVDDYRTLVDNMIELPSPPFIIQRLYAIFSMEEISAYEIAKVVETDQSFTARVLRLVNSPFYGLTRKIAGIEEAVCILGFNAIRQLLLTASLLKAFKMEGQSAKVADFWIHSMGVAIIARRLLMHRDKETQSEAFMGGILHDVGRLVFLKSDPNRFSSLYIEKEAVTDLKNETESFGINHQQVGGMLAQKWNFPESICDVVGKHHSPLESSKFLMLVSAINIADLLCHALGIGQSGNFYVSEFFPEAWRSLGLSYDDLERRLSGVHAEIVASEKSIFDLHK